MQILRERPQVHPRKDGSKRCIGLSSDALTELYGNLSAGSPTLETGCGLSTYIFALAGCRHVAITPNRTHIQETRKGAESYGISLDKVSFVERRSEDVLPSLAGPDDLEVVLIDGGHAFPIPYIDWFYSSRRLVSGGLLVLDDVNMRTVRILDEFLEMQPEWKKELTIGKTAFYRKSAELVVEEAWDYWRKQPFNSAIGARFKNAFATIWRRLRPTDRSWRG